MMGAFLSLDVKPNTNPWVLLFCALTAFTLQILSNLANDYGDFVKGVDNDKRTGPQRTLQSGSLTELQMRNGIVVTAFMALVFGALLLFVFVRLTWLELAIFVALGVAAVLAALLYTLGGHPYGYRGLGDLFCFLFFGWVAVAGTFYLSTRIVDFAVLLPATAMGCLSNAVLNINNMRDHDNDKAAGKNSLVVKMGLKKAFVYHCLLIGLSFVCLTIYLLLKQARYYQFAFWLLLPLFLRDLLDIKRNLDDGVPDNLLPKQVRNTFLLALAFGVLKIVILR